MSESGSSYKSSIQVPPLTGLIPRGGVAQAPSSKTKAVKKDKPTRRKWDICLLAMVSSPTYSVSILHFMSSQGRQHRFLHLWPTSCATRLLLGTPRLLDHCRSPHARKVVVDRGFPASPWDSPLKAHDERRTAPLYLRRVSAFLGSPYEDILLTVLVVVYKNRRKKEEMVWLNT